ncbi:MAG: tRNA pseudouridine(13) synthase TruD [Thermoplasmatales archaeon]|nr:MAG: tRNA pseudouridine(13) synthase TruD [Thermoplasmatales archaeon]
MNVLDAEKNIGIETFFTSFKGIGGKLRTFPEDFIVSEISSYPSKNECGRFAIADVTTTNWETNLLVRELSNRLRISRQRIGFAGNKDKRAKTTQLISFDNIQIEKISKLKISDIAINNVYRSNRPVKIGDLLGNRFDIKIRNIDLSTNHKKIQNLVSYLLDNGGFPNFYGIQRFGIIRPITHIVGKYIVHGDFEKAVMTYIGNPINGEDGEVYALREKLQKTHNFSAALSSYPSFLNFEKAILNKLVVNQKDFVGALKELPKNLLTMFVYAYQSYLFNKILSERIKRKIPLNEAIVGDVIIPIRNGVFDEQIINVDESNINKANTQISKGKAVVSGVLFGSDSSLSCGEMGEIEKKILDGEKINLRDFIITEIPYMSSSGSRRPILAPIKNFEFSLNIDDAVLILKFELNKGCYATSVLREFMKTNSIRNY